jgi:hypothetical protein
MVKNAAAAVGFFLLLHFNVCFRIPTPASAPSQLSTSHDDADSELPAEEGLTGWNNVSKLLALLYSSGSWRHEQLLFSWDKSVWSIIVSHAIRSWRLSPLLAAAYTSIVFNASLHNWQARLINLHKCKTDNFNNSSLFSFAQRRRSQVSSFEYLSLSLSILEN